MEKISAWRQSILIPLISEEKMEYIPDVLECVFTNAIEICAKECLKRNNGEICTTLSGGIDSSFCLAIIREIVGPNVAINTFTIGGSEQHPDILFARTISEFFNTIHHELIPQRREINEAKNELSFRWINEPQRPGDVAVFLTYKNIAKLGFRCSIAHDGIDELLGGYLEHRKHKNRKKKTDAFQSLWARLEEEHLTPLEEKASHFGIGVIFPYLQEVVVEYISKIPIDERTSSEVSKIPLRNIAKKCLPLEIIKRKKYGFSSALEK